MMSTLCSEEYRNKYMNDTDEDEEDEEGEGEQGEGTEDATAE